MTRAVLGVLVLNALYAGLGAAVLRASGFRVAGRIGAVGLSLALGWTAFAIIASVAIVAGLSLGVPQIVALVAATAAAALLAAKRWPAPEEPAMPALETAGWHRFVGDGTATVLGAYLGLLVARSLFAVADRNWDSWAFWLPKAKSIHFFGGLETTAGGYTSFANPEYPPAAPALDAATYAFAGGVEAWPSGLQHALAGAAFFVAAGALLGRRVPGWILWPSLLALALAPDLALAFDAALADLAVAYLVGLGGITGALWLLEGSRPPLVLCGLFLAAASLTKSEGFALSLALVAALAAASLFGQRRGCRCSRSQRRRSWRFCSGSSGSRRTTSHSSPCSSTPPTSCARASCSIGSTASNTRGGSSPGSSSTRDAGSSSLRSRSPPESRRSPAAQH